jgi:hypothetical protein
MEGENKGWMGRRREGKKGHMHCDSRCRPDLCLVMAHVNLY